MIFEFAEVEIESVGDGGLEEAPETFHRIELWAVGWERQQPQIGRNAGVIGGQMETGLVGDDDMQRRGIGVGDLLEKDGVDVPIDGRRQQQFARMSPVHFQGFVEIAPLVGPVTG